MRHIESPIRAHSVRGFTLVELLIAILIGLFLAAGLLTLVQAMKRTNTSQSGLSQLQDNERMGMSLISGAVQSAGYYPNPQVNQASTFFVAQTSPADTATGAVTLAASQSITGSVNSINSALGDQITVRYTTAGADNVLNCVGATSATQQTWSQTFVIDSNQNLVCSLYDGVNPPTVVPLVNGVTKLTVLYGVQTNASTLYNSADTYLAAASMTTAYWNAIRSVKITLTFNNPLHGQPGQNNATVQATIPFTRVISVMNKTGVDT
jgi:type IV pilus assembly protein PilW